MFKIIILVLLAEIFMATGQILFKKCVNAMGSHILNGVNSHIRFLTEILTKPLIWLGLFSIGIGLVAWIMALAEGDLSLVFPIGSIHYILILILAHIFLGEKLDRMKFTGTLLVMFGIVLIAMS